MPRAKLSTVTAKGDRRRSLERLRQTLAEAIDADPPKRDLAALSNRLIQVLDALAELDGGDAQPKESKRDELARRRSEREAAG